MVDMELEKDKAIAKLVRLAREHPKEAKRAGQGIWDEIEAKIQEIVDPKIARVQRQRAVALEARLVVLNPTHRPPTEVTENSFWDVYVAILEKRRVALTDLDDTELIEVLVEGLAERSLDLAREQARNHPIQPQSAPDIEDHVAGVREQHFDLESAATTALAPPLVISNLLKDALNKRDTTYTLDEYWRLAVLYLLVEALEVPSVELGLPVELRLGKNETTDTGVFDCRDLCRTYLTDMQDRVPEGYLELACRVAERLEAAMRFTSAREPQKEWPPREPPKSARIDLVDAVQKYRVPRETLHTWKERHKTVLSPHLNNATGKVNLSERGLYDLLRTKKRF